MVPAQCVKHFPFDLFPLLRVNNQINPNGRFKVSKAKKAFTWKEDIYQNTKQK